METIIGLLFILLPFIFKLIGKKLEQAGQSDTAERMKEIAQYMGAEEEQDVMSPEADYAPTVPVIEPDAPAAEPVVPVIEPVRMKFTENVQRQVPPEPKKTKKPILLEETEKKGEKIDPKKLVIYSEIMKPKYTE